MSAHRNDKNTKELKTYFNSVIDWVSTVFIDVLKEMQGLEWGRLYEEHHGKAYDPKKMADEVKKLAADGYVNSRKGIFEFLLGGSVDPLSFLFCGLNRCVEALNLLKAGRSLAGVLCDFARGLLDLFPAITDGLCFGFDGRFTRSHHRYELVGTLLVRSYGIAVCLDHTFQVRDGC
jgi:hypothetical protein